ncbi:MAG: exo-alpha-sialidase [Candidatus Limnocylindrales bacterium]
MTARVQILLGTKKGAFILESDATRREWTVRGPFGETWSMQHLIRSKSDGALYAGGGSAWYGASVWRSDDDGTTWTQSSEGLTYGDDGPKLIKVWNITPSNGTLYAGVEPAGLFRSQDSGRTWSHVSGLRDHPTTPEWQPGNGGLCLHSIVPHPTDSQRMWVGISAVGAFETIDGGATWETRNKGVRADFNPDPNPVFGQCVHKMHVHPDHPEVLYQQNHCGVYRSDDGGRAWTEITPGLPSQFGFPLALHPHDPSTIYVIPLNGDDKGRHMLDGKAAVWRSRDRGDSWTRLSNGLPQDHAYLGVLREAMAMDALETPGIYFGTSTGQVFGSSDEGENWTLIADFLPSISSVETALVGD